MVARHHHSLNQSPFKTLQKVARPVVVHFSVHKEIFQTLHKDLLHEILLRARQHKEAWHVHVRIRVEGLSFGHRTFVVLDQLWQVQSISTPTHANKHTLVYAHRHTQARAHAREYAHSRSDQGCSVRFFGSKGSLKFVKVLEPSNCSKGPMCNFGKWALGLSPPPSNLPD
jgi:hypothetical protein